MQIDPSRGAMTPATDDDIAVAQSSIPLLSRRRGTLATSASSDRNDGGAADIEQGAAGGGVVGGGAAEESMISVRVKTAGDGREYKVSSSVTTTIAQVTRLFPHDEGPPASSSSCGIVPSSPGFLRKLLPYQRVPWYIASRSSRE